MLDVACREKLKELVREQKIRVTWLPLSVTNDQINEGQGLFHPIQKSNCTDGVRVGVEELMNYYSHYDIVVMQPTEEIYYHILKDKLKECNVFVLSSNDNAKNSPEWDGNESNFLPWLLDDRRSIFLVQNHILRNSFKRRKQEKK